MRKINRQLIDHNDMSFDQYKENTNQKLIEMLNDAKRKKNATQLAQIMNVAHKPSPYKEKGLQSLGSLLFNNLDGSTGGEFGDFPNQSMNYKNYQELQLHRHRIKDFSSVIPQERSKRGKDIRYNSVQRMSNRKNVQQELKCIRENKRVYKESDRTKNYATSKLNENVRSNNAKSVSSYDTFKSDEINENSSNIYRKKI